MDILNGQEAFAAMMAGKQVLCRRMGDVLGFDPLENFPATIFATHDVEFCIKIETIEVAGITFTQPLTLDEVQQGDDVYIVQANGEIHHYKYTESNQILVQSVSRGFAQRDQENAKLQAEAFCKLFDRVYRQAEVVEMSAQPKPKRGRKSKVEDTYLLRENEVPAEDEDNQNQTANDVEEKTLVQHAEDEIETDPMKIIGEFTTKINACTTTASVLSLRYSFLANGHLEREHQQQLYKCVDEKLLELDPEQYAPKTEPATDETSEPSLIDEIDQQATKAVQDTIYKNSMSGNGQSSYPIDMLYTKKKQMLINKIQEMDSVESLERLAPAIPNARLNPEDHQELLRIYAERKIAMQHADQNREAAL